LNVLFVLFSLAWVSQIIVRLLNIVSQSWKSFFLWLCLPPLCGKIVVNTTFSERPNFLFWSICSSYSIICSFLSFVIQFSMTIAS